MTRDHDSDRTNRRGFMRSAGAAGAALAGLAAPSAAARGGREPLADPAANFAVYWSDGRDGVASADEPNDPADFGFPDDPFLAGVDPGGGGGVFDGTRIEITPDHRTLYNSMVTFFGGFVIADKRKPFTMVNQGDGLFESVGHSLTFEARPKEEIKRAMEEAGFPAGFVDHPPLSVIAGETWRAGTVEQLKIDLDDPDYTAEWASFRTDFYDRSGGELTYTLSLHFVVWREGETAFRDRAMQRADAMIRDGRLNPGGQ